MTSFLCDRPEVEAHLRRIHELLRRGGGSTHPQLTVRAAEDELSVLSDLDPASAEALIHLPDSCLPRLDDFDWGFVQDRLVIRSHKQEAPESHVRLAETMTELFNTCNKIASHRRTNPWFALAGAPEVLDHFCQARIHYSTYAEYRGLYDAGQGDELAIKTFFDTRVFAVELGGAATEVLMPLVDCTNHHFLGRPFRTMKTDGGAALELSLLNCKPLPGSNECFVRYNRFDALDTYFLQDFIDPLTEFVRSIPLELEPAGIGTLAIESRVGFPVLGKLPPELEDLRYYLPNVLDLRDGAMRVSHLIIPGRGAPRALRRALVFLLRSLKPDVDADTLRDAVLSAERSMVQANLEYYERLGSLAHTHADSLGPQTVAMVRGLADRQIANLNRYVENIKAVGHW
jgi:hypothetical protein